MRAGVGLGLGLMGVLGFSGATGQEAGQDLRWESRPTPNEVIAVIPAAAKAADRDGHVQLTCAVAGDRRLSGCTVAGEEPAGLGYGQAALRLAPKYRLAKESASGRGSVTFPLHFRPNVVPPDWIKKPGPGDLAAVWPTEALKRGVDGRATLLCEITREGTLRKCKVVAEEPEGMGFGAAAVALTPQYLMRAPTRNGQPIEGEMVRFTTNFDPGGPRSPAALRDYRRTITRPTFTAAPTRAEVAAAHPAAARDIAGRVTMDCEADANGALHRCSVQAEEPRGRGFGKAARDLAPRFRLAPTFPDGESVKGLMIRVPVQFSPGLQSGEQIAKPEWARLPEAEPDYPAKAVAAGVKTGRVVLDCRVQVGGGLGDCRVASENPSGVGFGEAALALSRGFFMRPWTSDGRPVDGSRARVPVTYQWDEEAAKP
jgi:TonB family protein